MKIKEEFNTLKEEVETVSKKRHELIGEELAQVLGGKEEYYTVKSGDCLDAIAQKYGTTAVQLVKWNNIKNTDCIYPGLTIRVK